MRTMATDFIFYFKEAMVKPFSSPSLKLSLTHSPVKSVPVVMMAIYIFFSPGKASRYFDDLSTELKLMGIYDSLCLLYPCL